MNNEDGIKEVLAKLSTPLPVCRVCFQETQQYVNFAAPLCTVGEIELTYFDGYKDLAKVNPKLDQDLPTQFCVQCADDLCNAYLFSKRVESAESTFKRIRIFTTEQDDNVEDNENFDHIDVERRVLEINPNSELEAAIDPDAFLLCKDCGKMCTSLESYKKHCLPHQLNGCDKKIRKSIKCKQCGKTFKIYADLEKHLLIHAMADVQMTKGGKMSYVCNACHKSYKSILTFIDHMHIHNGTKPYKCSICGVLRHTRVKLKSHKYHSHGKGFEVRRAIKKEKQMFMKAEPHRFKTKCRYCGQLVVKEIIKRHEKMHENPEKKYQCSVCKKAFYTEQNLKFHSETHLAVRKPLACTICGQEILRQYSLKLHMQRHADKDKKFKCDICGTVLSSKGAHTEHREKHFSHNNYKCELCAKTFIRKSRLVYHMRSHTGENPFECNQCERSFKMYARLNSHISVAHANQTFDCSNCDAKFKSYGGYVNHQFVHTGFPFECPQCKKGIPNRERLKKHLLQVHKGYITLERFDELYPKKTETRKVKVIDAEREVTIDVNSDV